MAFVPTAFYKYPSTCPHLILVSFALLPFSLCLSLSSPPRVRVYSLSSPPIELGVMAEENAEHQNGAGEAVAFASFKPQLVVPAQKADEAVKFYKAAFGAEELKRMMYPKRKAEQELPLILCAELKIGSSAFLVCDQSDDSSAVKEVAGGNGSAIVFRLETDDVEGAISNAVKAGATLVGEITPEEGGCGGGLSGKVKDPFGVAWAIASSTGKKCAEPEA